MTFCYQKRVCGWSSCSSGTPKSTIMAMYWFNIFTGPKPGTWQNYDSFGRCRSHHSKIKMIMDWLICITMKWYLCTAMTPWKFKWPINDSTECHHFSRMITLIILIILFLILENLIKWQSLFPANGDRNDLYLVKGLIWCVDPLGKSPCIWHKLTFFVTAISWVKETSDGTQNSYPRLHLQLWL